jgi:hypothetical protein
MSVTDKLNHIKTENIRDPYISYKKVTNNPVSREKDLEAVEYDNEDT